MLDCASFLLQHYVTQCRVSIRGRAIRDCKIPAGDIAREEDCDIVDSRARVFRIGRKWELSTRSHINGDVKRIFVRRSASVYSRIEDDLPPPSGVFG